MPDPDLIGLLARELHQKMAVGGDSFFFPTGGAFLTITLERLQELRRPDRTSELADGDVYGIYAQWHEAVHMVQMLTSPYVFLHAFMLAALGREGLRISDQRSGVTPATLREQYLEVDSQYQRTTEGYNPWEIVETQAVTQGLLWTMPDADGDSLWWVANRRYSDRPDYLRVLNSTAERFGKEVAFKLLPGLCFLALQTNNPAVTMSRLIDRIDSESLLADLCAYTSPGFCEWANSDPSLVSLSLRERAATLRDLNGRPLDLYKHPCLRFYDQYFQDFESVSGVADRLDLAMGARGGTTFTLFAPMFTVFADGRVLTSSKTPRANIEPWLRLTLDQYNGLSFVAPKPRVASF